MHKCHKLFKIEFNKIDVQSPETDKTSKRDYITII